MDKHDAQILGKVYATLLTYGAASTERIVSETKLEQRSVLWALWQLRATERGGLHTLPDAMLPSGWEVEPAA
jgi:hypothetical protein